MTQAELYLRMLRIRRFEERVLELFAEGELQGTTHAYIGQEAVAVGLFSHLNNDDTIVSNHRCHGHYLCHQDDPVGLLAELMGLANGVCGGRGGSQHLCRGNFYTNGVQGGLVPMACGLALAKRQLDLPGITVVFLGDGTLGEGQVYESMNIASLWSLPLLFVIENNFYSQSTPSHLQISGQIAARPEAFDIDTTVVDSNDVLLTRALAGEAIEGVRKQLRPACLVFNTFRLCSHSKSDDGRPQEVIEPWREKDPLLLLAQKLPLETIEELTHQVEGELADWVEQARAGGKPQLWSLPELDEPEVSPFTANEGERVSACLNRALSDLLEGDSRVVFLGEDILDPYGGAFKVARGLSTLFPKRVLTTPVSETSITGIAAGMALGGLRPVVEIMFGDFLTLCVDPLANYASKFRAMYNDQVRVPMVLRTPMGGRRGYGPTHSQSIEKLMLGFPDLRLVAPSIVHDPGALLQAAVADEAPVVFVENKVLYTRRVRKPDGQGWLGDFRVQQSAGPYPEVLLSLVDFGPARASLVTYGGMAEIAMEAAERLLVEHEVACEVLVFSRLWPLREELLFDSLSRTQGVLVTLEEGIVAGGWGSELVSRCAEAGRLRRAARVGAEDICIPASRVLEEQVLPSVGKVIKVVSSLL